MSGNTQYVMRLYRARCKCGTLDNYLNIPRDHGILAGAEQQPLMNANDHTDKHVIHFGKCNSDHNPERMFRKGLVSGLMGPIGFLVGGAVTDFLEDVGIMTCNCKPNTPNPWIEVNEDNLIEGAPALLMESKLTCRYGGVITLVPFDEYPPEAPADAAAETPTEAPPPNALDTVNNAMAGALEDAMAAVASTGDAGAEASFKVQCALAAAAAMPPQTSASPHSCELDSGVPNDISDITYDSMFSITDSQRAKNYAHNMAQTIDPAALDETGMIINQRLLSNFVINNYGADYAGCGAISLYNATKILDPQSDISFPQAINWMEPYGVLNNTFGAIPAGITHAFNEMGYETQYCFSQDPAEVSKAAAQADAAIILYATTGNVHYVAMQPDPIVLSSDTQQPQTFTFYNESGGVNDSRTYEDFHASLSDENRQRIGSVTILVNKPK